MVVWKLLEYDEDGNVIRTPGKNSTAFEHMTILSEAISNVYEYADCIDSFLEYAGMKDEIELKLLDLAQQIANDMGPVLDKAIEEVQRPI